MTLSEIAASKELLLKPEDVASVLGVSAQSIRNEASRDHCRLGFKVIRMDRTTLIPRLPFLRFIGAAEEVEA